MNRIEHEAAVVAAAIRWQGVRAGDWDERDTATESLSLVVQELRRSRGDYQLADGTGIPPAEDELAAVIEAQHDAHGLEATPRSIAVCRTVVAGWIMLAHERLELLTALVHAIDGHDFDGPIPIEGLRARLDDAYDAGVPPELDAEPVPAPVATLSRFEDFARRVVAGEDVDAAAVAVGGTGRR